jgi:hypothetical protein
VLEQIVAVDEHLHALAWGLHDVERAHRLVVELIAGGDRLPGQPELQISGVTLEDADVADHVVQRLVARAEDLRIDGGEVVLGVDPLDHQPGGRQDRLQRRGIGVGAPVVGVKEGPALEVQARDRRARADDERGVPGQAPLGAHLGPVAGPAPRLVAARQPATMAARAPARAPGRGGRRRGQALLDQGAQAERALPQLRGGGGLDERRLVGEADREQVDQVGGMRRLVGVL